MYKVMFDKRVKKDLEKIPESIIDQIKNKILNHISLFPKELGKRLQGNIKGLYSSRHGDHRIIYKVLESQKTIIITNIGHRSDVYKTLN